MVMQNGLFNLGRTNGLEKNFWFQTNLEISEKDGWVFANGPVASYQRLKMVLDTFLFNTQRYKVRIEGKMEQSREKSSALPCPTLRCSSYWKGSLLVALDYSRQLLH